MTLYGARVAQRQVGAKKAQMDVALHFDGVEEVEASVAVRQGGTVLPYETSHVLWQKAWPADGDAVHEITRSLHFFFFGEGRL